MATRATYRLCVVGEGTVDELKQIFAHYKIGAQCDGVIPNSLGDEYATAKLNNEDGEAAGASIKVDGILGGLLGKLEPEKLAMHAETLAARLEDEKDASVRKEMLEVLGKLKPAVLAQHEEAVIKRLEDGDAFVRGAAVVALDRLEARDLARHALVLVGRLPLEEEPAVRKALGTALLRLEKEAGSSAEAVEDLRQVKDAGVSVGAKVTERLQKLWEARTPGCLEAVKLVEWLEYEEDGPVRAAAAVALGKLKAEELAEHVHVLVNLLRQKGESEAEAEVLRASACAAVGAAKLTAELTAAGLTEEAETMRKLGAKV